MSNEDISKATIALIDSLKSTTSAFGLAGTGSEYRIVIEMFLYKFFNDKFGYEAKKDKVYGPRLAKADKWDAEYDKFTEDEVEDLFSYLPAAVPRLKPEHTLSHLYNSATSGDFSTLLDSTLVDISNLNAEHFSVTTSGKSKVNIFNTITTNLTDIQKRDEFAKSLMRNVASFNFEDVFSEKYDFFSRIFEHLLKGFNNAGGGKYAEYYTPRAIAQVMARLLVGKATDLRSITCYDPAAGTGTLLMALAHQIGENRCSIFSQDISEKSSDMLRLNLILNNLSASLPNVVQGNTLTEPSHKEAFEFLDFFLRVTIPFAFEIDNNEDAKHTNEPINSGNDKFEPVNEPVNSDNDEFEPINEPINSGNDKFEPVNEPVNSGNDEFEPINEPINSGNDKFEPINEPINPGNDEFEPINEPINSGNDKFEPINEPINPIQDESEPINLIIKIISQEPYLTKELIAEKIGKSRSTVTRIITRLIKSGIIRRVGSNKNGYWEIANGASTKQSL